MKYETWWIASTCRVAHSLARHQTKRNETKPCLTTTNDKRPLQTTNYDAPGRCCSPPWHPPNHQTGDPKVVARPRSPLGSAPPKQEKIKAPQPVPRKPYNIQHGTVHPALLCVFAFEVCNFWLWRGCVLAGVRSHEDNHTHEYNTSYEHKR